MVANTSCHPRHMLAVTVADRPKSPNDRHVTKRVIIYVNAVVSGRNYDILTSIIAQLLTR